MSLIHYRLENLLNFGNNTIRFSDGTIMQWGLGFAGTKNREFSNTLSTDFLSTTIVVASHTGTVASKTNIVTYSITGNKFAAVSEWEGEDKIKILYIAIGRWK